MQTSISILDLPEDVIEVILSKCSAKSVVRLKSVCKQWQSMSSDPRFCRAHHLQRRSKNANRFMEFSGADFREFRAVRFIARFMEFRAAHIDIHVMMMMRLKDGKMVRESNFRFQVPRKFSTYPICYCDGICMFRAELQEGEGEDDDDEYLLLNPSIHKHTVIRGPMDGDGDDLRIFSLYHDSRDGGDYKVVRVLKQHYAVYSCRNMRWGEMRDLPCRRSLAWDRTSTGGRFFNLHGDDDEEVQCFDSRDGHLHTFASPREAQGVHPYLVALSGELFYVTLQPQTVFYHQLWKLIMPDIHANFCWKLTATAEHDKPGPLADQDQYFPFLENLYLPSSNFHY